MAATSQLNGLHASAIRRWNSFRWIVVNSATCKQNSNERIISNNVHTTASLSLRTMIIKDWAAARSLLRESRYRGSSISATIARTTSAHVRRLVGPSRVTRSQRLTSRNKSVRRMRRNSSMSMSHWTVCRSVKFQERGRSFVKAYTGHGYRKVPEEY